MQIVTAREFRSNQSKILSAAKNGQSVIITSRLGSFKITPVTDDDVLVPQDITDHIIQGLHEVQLMESGKITRKSAKAFLDEL